MTRLPDDYQSDVGWWVKYCRCKEALRKEKDKNRKLTEERDALSKIIENYRSIFQELCDKLEGRAK